MGVLVTDLSEYDYELPSELIAQRALKNRSDARMLVVGRNDQSMAHAHVRDLPEYLRPLDCLVLNDTRVLPARLVGYRMATRGRWSGLFLAANAQGHWEVMCKTRGRLRAGESIMLENRQAQDAFRLTLLADLGDGMWVAQPAVAGPPAELLDQVGRVPLPPYIRGGTMEESDVEQYQTVFARHPGAIAAPTAGLHFTTELLGRLVDTGVAICRLTLHVGVGTFRPVTSQRIEDHRDALRMGRDQRGHRAADRDVPQLRRTCYRRGYHQRPGAGDGRTRRATAGLAGRDRSVHSAAVRIPERGRVAH